MGEGVIKVLLAMDVLAVGVNCGNTLEENLKALTAMRTAAPEVTLMAKPNAGLPRMENGVEAVYDVTPEIMADYALKFGTQHVKMIGGCCGSNPNHIAALRDILKNFEPPPLDEVLATNHAAAQSEDESDHRSRRRGGSSR